MKITKEDIEKSIHEYNKAIKELEDAGIDYDNYTVTISHARWIKLLTILKTHIEAWEKLRTEIMAIGNWRNESEISDNGVKDCLAIIDRHIAEIRGD